MYANWLARYKEKNTYATDYIPGKGVFKAAAVDFSKQMFLNEKIAGKIRSAIATHIDVINDDETFDKYASLVRGSVATCLSEL